MEKDIDQKRKKEKRSIRILTVIVVILGALYLGSGVYYKTLNPPDLILSIFAIGIYLSFAEVLVESKYAIAEIRENADEIKSEIENIEIDFEAVEKMAIFFAFLFYFFKAIKKKKQK